MSRRRQLFRRSAAALLALASLRATSLAAQGNAVTPGRLLFQTDHAWSPRTNINADTVLVYGDDATFAERISSWKQHGYRVAFMTGVAWGRYGAYLRGEFDGKQHWDETQQEQDGTLRLHSGREVPYFVPTTSYGRFLVQRVLAALDAGAESVYLEEPEFWADTGWSASFKREWVDFYHQPWQPPDSSPDAQYRASKLKYNLYRRALGQVFEAAKQYGETHHRHVPCYVATHSLINYAQWDIVSPESSLLQVGADGYIAQVWTGTARTPNVLDGTTQQRTFETAFLEYGALQNIARASGKPIWYLNDPIEDNPNHSWADYRQNWESTLVASLLQPAVSRYEVLPWPDRIFQSRALYPSVEPTPADPAPPKVPIPASYATELQSVFHALGELTRASETRWTSIGSEGIGVVVADTLMFQRSAPQPSDAHLSNFYGLALPLLQHGIPVEPVQMKTASAANLQRYRVLLLTYEGQKPPSPAFHALLTQWVKAGGTLVVVDDDRDPYNHVREWWNTGSNHFATPREQLFQQLGVAPAAKGAQTVGKGTLLYAPLSPTALSQQSTGGDQVMRLLHTASSAAGFSVQQTGALVLRRGPYVVAAGLDALPDDSAQGSKRSPFVVTGKLINLFDADLSMARNMDVHAGSRAFLLDTSNLSTATPRVIAASAKIAEEHFGDNTLTFTAEGIEDTKAAVRILVPHTPKAASLNGQALTWEQDTLDGESVLLRFRNMSAPQKVQLQF